MPLDRTKFLAYIPITSLSEGRQPVTPIDGAGCGACGPWFVAMALGLHGGTARRHYGLLPGAG